jgi:hypothetical protein
VLIGNCYGKSRTANNSSAAARCCERCKVHVIDQQRTRLFVPRGAVSAKGARGLTQLMPATAQRLGVRDSCNINQNISGGVRYLAWLKRLFHNDPRLLAASYYRLLRG